MAPNFELETLTGELIRLSDYQGKPVLLSFGASWCPPCRAEVLTLQELHETYPTMVVLMVNIGEDYWTVQDFAEEYGLRFTVAIDEYDQISRFYGVYAIPALFFIDPQGLVQGASVGAPTDQQMEQFLMAIGVSP